MYRKKGIYEVLHETIAPKEISLEGFYQREDMQNIPTAQRKLKRAKIEMSNIAQCEIAESYLNAIGELLYGCQMDELYDDFYDAYISEHSFEGPEYHPDFSRYHGNMKISDFMNEMQPFLIRYADVNNLIIRKLEDDIQED